MSKISMKLMLAGALALSSAAPGFARSWHSDDTAALIGGVLLGGIAAAASSHDHRHRDQYVPPPPHRPSMAPFSPAIDVVCYPREGACYNNDGDFLPTWTRRAF